MKSLLFRYSTQITLGLFLVSAVSGTALFFHVGPGYFHGMHEWLSMVLLAPFVFHVWKNWAALVAYVRRRTLLLPVAATLVAAACFAFPSQSGRPGGGPPAMQAMRFVTGAKLKDLAPVLDTSSSDLIARLHAQGVAGATEEDSIAGLAESTGKPMEQVLMLVIRPAH